MEFTVGKSKIYGKIKIPPSKSHTIRALIIATLANGKSTICEPLESLDTLACLEACSKLGARISKKDNEWIVEGTGKNLKIPDDIIDVKNSGTTLYIALGVASLCRGWTLFTGDYQIKKRPATGLISSLNELGAKVVSTRENGCAPFIVKGVLKGGKTSIKCPTSQYLTSLLINCPLAENDTEIKIIELNEKPYIDMTMDWLNSQNISYSYEDSHKIERIYIKGGQQYHPFNRRITGDFSSASFFLCAAAITKSNLTLCNLDMNDSQGDKKVVEILKKMGCNIKIYKDNIEIKGSELAGGEFDINSIPDALPVLAVTGCFAEGETILYNVGQARLKETDRITTMRMELEKMGADITEISDGLVIRKSNLYGTKIDGHNDHRVVMSLVIAGLGAEGTTSVNTAEAVGVTFPNFFNLLNTIKC